MRKALLALPPGSCEGLAAYCADGDASGLGAEVAGSLCYVLEVFTTQIAAYLSFDNTRATLRGAGASGETEQLFADAYDAAMVEFQPTCDAMFERAEVLPGIEDLTARVEYLDGRAHLRLEVEPFSVHLLRFTAP